MFSVARIAWRSTDSNVRLPTCGVMMMLSISLKDVRRLDRLVFEHVGRVAAELAGFAGVGDVLLD